MTPSECESCRKWRYHNNSEYIISRQIICSILLFEFHRDFGHPVGNHVNTIFEKFSDIIQSWNHNIFCFWDDNQNTIQGVIVGFLFVYWWQFAILTKTTNTQSRIATKINYAKIKIKWKSYEKQMLKRWINHWNRLTGEQWTFFFLRRMYFLYKGRKRHEIDTGVNERVFWMISSKYGTRILLLIVSRLSIDWIMNSMQIICA